MKLGIFYTVFDGTELLQGAINEVLPYVDKVLIISQSISNTGEIDNDVGWNILELSNNMSQKIMCTEYEPNLTLNIKENERRKHNKAIQLLRAEGCTHFIMSACDHYYIPEEFLKAKIKANDYDVTLTNMYTYFKNPEWRLEPIEEYQMPFICKMYPETQIDKKEYKGFRTDPSVRINTRKKIYYFRQEEIMLHHYSMVRIDIKKKFRNAAIFKRTEEQIRRYELEYENYDLKSNIGVKYFGDRKIKLVPNLFNISLKG